MTNPDENPYASTDTYPSVTTPSARRWPVIVTLCACVYYGISAITLPFVNSVWFGEIPPLAVFQFPKPFIKAIVHDLLLDAMHFLGISYGSASPDYGATHFWAMGIMVAAPAFFIVAVFAVLPRDRMRNKLIAAVLFFASIDAIVTICFDYSSSLKLYNASFFYRESWVKTREEHSDYKFDISGFKLLKNHA